MIYIKDNELWIRFNEQVYFKLIDISEETKKELIKDGVKNLSKETIK